MEIKSDIQNCSGNGNDKNINGNSGIPPADGQENTLSLRELQGEGRLQSAGG